MSATLNRKIFTQSVGIIFLLLLCLGCSSIKNTLPKEKQLSKKIDTSTQILHALHLEETGHYRQSQQIWTQFKKDSKKSEEHVFKASLIIRSPSNSEELQAPQSEESKFLLSRFFIWRQKWVRALSTVNSLEENSDLKNKSILQKINILLALGRYQEARLTLERNDFPTFDLNYQKALLWSWYHILTNNPGKAMETMKVLESEYLYLPITNLIPMDYLLKDYKNLPYLQQSIIRFPDSVEAVETLAFHYLDHFKWRELESLLKMRNHYEPKNKYWRFYGELYLGTNQLDKLQTLLQFQEQRQERSQPYFDLKARMLIATKKWDYLKVLAQDYIKFYPELIDGQLFLAEYYRFTGQAKKKESLLQSIR